MVSQERLNNFVFEEILENSIRRVRKNRERTGSYRSFGVGSVFWASTAQGLISTDGWNYKQTKEDEKFCAEHMALIEVRKCTPLEIPKIEAVFVLGEPQPDSYSGLVSPTLHPCQKCRCILRRAPEMKDDTIICTVSLFEDTFEHFLFRDFLKLHSLIRLRTVSKG